MEANEKMVSSDTENYSRKKKKNKGVTVWILVAVIIIALAVGIGFVISRGSTKNLPEQLELGQKYMEEMDYEQAVVTFSGIIEIDDKCVEAYLGLTETYIRMGEYDKALETAQKGYERTGDERLAEYINMIENKKVTEQLNLGQKYLEEMDYEQAVVTFSRIIEIDDQCVEAYLGLTETYIRMGEYDKALETAQKGYERTGDERLTEYINMLNSGNVTRSDGKIMKRTCYDADGAVLYYHELTYDNEGREASVTHYNSAHTLVSSLDLLYDEEGNAVVSYTYGTQSGDLYKIESVYENGLLMSYKIHFEDYVTLYKNEYDEKGRVVRETSSTDFDSGEHSEFYSLYQYDENDNMIRKEDYGESELLYYSIYEYQNGELYKQSNYRSNGDLDCVWVNEKDGEYKYDSVGKLIQFTENE